MLKEIKTPLGTREEIEDALERGYSITVILHLLGINLKSKYDSINKTYTFIMLPSEYKKLLNFNKSYNIFELFNKLVGFNKVAIMAKLKKQEEVLVGTEDEFEQVVKRDDTDCVITSQPKEEKPKSFWRRLWKR